MGAGGLFSLPYYMITKTKSNLGMHTRDCDRDVRVCWTIIHQRECGLRKKLGGGRRREQHLNMEAQPAEDQTEWTMTGYTQAAMKKE